MGDSGPPAKRRRKDFLAGCQVFVPSTGIPHGRDKLAIWRSQVPARGGALLEGADAPTTRTTHAIVPAPEAGGLACIPEHLRPGAAGAEGVHYVAERWLSRCLELRKRVAEEDFPPPLERPGGAGGGDSAGSAGGLGAGHALEAWLGGRWRPECAEMDDVELMLQAVYDPVRAQRIGNHAAAQALREMYKYEFCLSGDTREALGYARAAAAVTACSYKLQPPVEHGQLPYVGKVTARKLTQILETGTCDELECFRHNLPVSNSSGQLREGTAGAAARREFCKLPSVGPATAREWYYKHGLRSFADVEAAAGMVPGAAGEARSGSRGSADASSEGGGSGGGGSAPQLQLSQAQRFALAHRDQILQGPTAAELEEMQQAVQGALAEALGARGGAHWRVEVVGGCRRELRPADDPERRHRGPEHAAGTTGGAAAGAVEPHLHHDVDFLCWLDGPGGDALQVGLVLERVRTMLISRGQLLPPEEAMCILESGARYESEARGEVGAMNDVREDRDRDRLHAIFRTRGGVLRKLDIFTTTPRDVPFALVAWNSSKQLNRFRSGFAVHKGMKFNTHGLFRAVEGKELRVPEGAAPADRQGRECWPPGWPRDAEGRGAPARTQREVHTLLGIPYLEEHQREA